MDGSAYIREVPGPAGDRQVKGRRGLGELDGTLNHDRSSAIDGERSAAPNPSAQMLGADRVFRSYAARVRLIEEDLKVQELVPDADPVLADIDVSSPGHLPWP